jgi:hypothetical protein
MGILNRDLLKTLFRTGAKPLQQDYWSWLDSFFHKEEKIPVDSVENLTGILEDKADSTAVVSAVSAHDASPTAHSDIRDLIGVIVEGYSFDSSKPPRRTGRKFKGKDIWRWDIEGNINSSGYDLFSVGFPYLEAGMEDDGSETYSPLRVEGVIYREWGDSFNICMGLNYAYDISGNLKRFIISCEDGIRMFDSDDGTWNFVGYKYYVSLEFLRESDF